jgi:arsenite-transporting ATPase
MRVLLYTGKGGVGKTTAAAATATLAARRGLKTLVVSTDTAHSLADTFGITAGGEPLEVEPGLFVHQVDTQRALEDSWRELQEYLTSLFGRLGMDPLAAEELTVVPGAEEVLALFQLRDHVRSGAFDVVIVDCAPTAETLRLLALPEVLGWYVNRLLPVERRVVGALRPVLSRVAGVPMPSGPVFDALERFHQKLAEVREILVAPDCSVRLVLTPEAVVVAEARRTLTSLSLYGYRVDAVLANRVFPAEGADDWRSGWVAAQAERLTEIESSFAPLPVYRAPYQPAEPVGPAALADLGGRIYGDDDPFARTDTPDPLVISPGDNGAYDLDLALPGAAKGEVDLARRGDDLVITVGAYRRVLALPAALTRRRVAGATLREGRLRVDFQPAPEDER